MSEFKLTQNYHNILKVVHHKSGTPFGCTTYLNAKKRLNMKKYDKLKNQKKNYVYQKVI